MALPDGSSLERKYIYPNERGKINYFLLELDISLRWGGGGFRNGVAVLVRLGMLHLDIVYFNI